MSYLSKECIREKAILVSSRWFKILFLYDSIYAMAIDKFLYLFKFFPVKSSCALVTWEEMVILPGEKLSCPGRNYQVTSAHDDFTEILFGALFNLRRNGKYKAIKLVKVLRVT